MIGTSRFPDTIHEDKTNNRILIAYASVDLTGEYGFLPSELGGGLAPFGYNTITIELWDGGRCLYRQMFRDNGIDSHNYIRTNGASFYSSICSHLNI